MDLLRVARSSPAPSRRMLRKLLVETKLDLAEAIAAREEAEHELRRIKRQAEERDRGSVSMWLRY